MKLFFLYCKFSPHPNPRQLLKLLHVVKSDKYKLELSSQAYLNLTELERILSLLFVFFVYCIVKPFLLYWMDNIIIAKLSPNNPCY